MSKKGQWVVTPENYYIDDPKSPTRYKRRLHQLSFRHWLTERWNPTPNEGGLKVEHFDWSSYPFYEDYKWVGTPDPFAKLFDAINKRTHKFIAVQAGTGLGKSYIGALLALYFADVYGYEGYTIGIVGASYEGLRSTFFKEIRNHFIRFQELNPWAYYKESPSLEIVNTHPISKKQNVFIGRGVMVKAGQDSNVSIAGYHNSAMLWIIDEGSGVHESIYNTLVSTSTDDCNFVVALGNPSHVGDPLHRFTSKASTLSIKMPSWDHPNVVRQQFMGEDYDGKTLIGGAATLRSLLDRKADYGETSSVYINRVMAEFVGGATDSLISAADIEACYELDLPREGVPNAAGIDLANSSSGDEAAVAIIQDNVLSYLKSVRCPNENVLASNLTFNGSDLEDEISPYTNSSELDYELLTIVGEDADIEVFDEYIGVDASTMYGCINEFNKLGVDVARIKPGEKPIKWLIEEDINGDPLYIFYNKRVQMLFMLKEAIEQRKISFNIPREIFDEFKRQLTSFKQEKFGTGRAIKLEPKKATAKRLGRSPDLADAVMYAWFCRCCAKEEIHPNGANSFGVDI